MEQTKKEILDQVKAIKELFTSFKFNKITSLIPNLFNQIRPINLSGFRINLTG